MPRYIFTFLLCAAALSPASPQPQDAPILVMFRPSEHQSLNAAIAAAFSQPPFQMAAKTTSDVLMITIPERVEVIGRRVSGTQLEFTVRFSRDGKPLGNSYESCNITMLTDCTDQLRADAKTAIGR